MFDPQITISWGGALVWLVGVAIAGFLISWIFADLRHGQRVPYVGVLAAATGGLTAGYLLWSGCGAAFWTNNWPRGILGAVVAGAFLALMISRVARIDHPGHGVSGVAAMWEGVVYGSAEGLLLSVLPVVATWQMFHAFEWTDGWRAWPAGAAAVAASIVVIVVHHLGYPEYRGAAVRFPVMGCAVLSIAYLITANPIAAMGGHIILHLAMMRRRMELPPHEHAEPVSVVRSPAMHGA